MKRLINIICLLSIFSVQFAQDNYYIRYNQYMTEGMLYNPAFAGSREVLSLAMFYRNDWMNIEGSPTFQTISAHTPLKNYKLGLGLLYMHNSYGISSENNLYFNYAYRINLPVGKLSLGLRGGGYMLTKDYSLISLDPPYNNDPNFSNAEKVNILVPNFGAGLYYYTHKFFLGASVPNFLSVESTLNDNGVKVSHNISAYTYYLTSGVELGKDESFKIIPSGLVQYRQNTPVQWQAFLNSTFLENRFSFGVGYRGSGEGQVLFQVKANEQLRIGAAYDYQFGDVYKYANGSLEIMIRYEFRYVIKAANPIDF